MSGATPEEARALLDQIATTLARYTFKPTNEAALQTMVTDVLQLQPGYDISREVTADPASRFDIMVVRDFVCVVLELKLNASPNAVERQAQRYAAIESVDGVAVVTTSARLAAKLVSPGGYIAKQVDTLAGKPYAVMMLRFM